MKKKLSFSICIPVYKGSAFLRQTLRSIVSQNYPYIEIIIGDDNPPTAKDEIKKTKKIINSFHNVNIRYIKHPRNLGCQENLNRIVPLARNEIVYLAAHDDVLSRNSLQRTNDAFQKDPDIGAVTRAYFWFDDDIKKPIRLKLPVDEMKDSVVSISDDPKKVMAIFNTVDNITGLAFKRTYLKVRFHQDMFTTHVYPFASIFRNHKVVCLKDYIFACRMETSQSKQPFSYIKSPMQSWIDMFNTVFREKKFKMMREACIRDFVARNYVGLVQIRNYAKYQDVLKEIYLLIKWRWQNIYHPLFLCIAVACLFTPRKILIPLTNWYKSRINSLIIHPVNFIYPS